MGTPPAHATGPQSINRVLGCQPETMVSYAQDLLAGNEKFVDLINAVHRAVDGTVMSWRGDASHAVSARSMAEKLAGTHIATAVVDLADRYNTYGLSLGNTKDALKAVVGEAASAGMDVEDSGTVTAPRAPLGTGSNAVITQATVQKQLDGHAQSFQARIRQLLFDFAMDEVKAATAINNVHNEIKGYEATPAGPAVSGQVQDIVSGKAKMPTDPTKLREFWDGLSASDKDALFQHDPSIGNLNGLPSADRDRFNRANVDNQITAAAASGNDLDTLTSQHPDWAKGENIPSGEKYPLMAGVPDGLSQVTEYQAWKKNYDKAVALKATDDALHPNPGHGNDPDRKLLLFDPDTGKRPRVAVAVGDPDTAQHISVTTPGLNTQADSITGMTHEAMTLRREAEYQLAQTPDHKHDQVSTIAWIGYDAPILPARDLQTIEHGGDLGGDLAGGVDVAHDDVARHGAHDLANFYRGIAASHDGDVPPQITANGHSYGSLTTGLALQELAKSGNSPVTDTVLYGSPGIEASTPEQLGLHKDHAFVMRTPDDPIRYAADSPKIIDQQVAEHVPVLGPILSDHHIGERVQSLSGLGQFGPDPATNPNFEHLDTGAAQSREGGPQARPLLGASGHSDYPRLGDHDQLRTTEYNMAAVVAGLPNNAVRTQ